MMVMPSANFVLAALWMGYLTLQPKGDAHRTCQGFAPRRAAAR
jgi:hypothetical protein